MSLESILQNILNEADTQRDKIIQEAQSKYTSIIQQAQEEAERIYQESLFREKGLWEKQRQRLLVHARLERKKKLLKAKQELIDLVFARLKTKLNREKLRKQRVSYERVQEVDEDIDAYLDRLKIDYAPQIASLLFGE